MMVEDIVAKVEENDVLLKSMIFLDEKGNSEFAAYDVTRLRGLQELSIAGLLRSGFSLDDDVDPFQYACGKVNFEPEGFEYLGRLSAINYELQKYSGDSN